jgi:hypothetical protein
MPKVTRTSFPEMDIRITELPDGGAWIDYELSPETAPALESAAVQEAAAKAVKMLDLLIEFFGEVGHRWNSGIPSDKYGGRCLTNALEHLRAVNDIKGDRAGNYLYHALPAPWTDLEDFNDDCRSYDPIRDLIERARQLALADIDIGER